MSNEMSTDDSTDDSTDLEDTISYDLSLYNSNELRKWAKLYSDVLPPSTTFLLSAGISGATLASAILMIRDSLVHCNVRPNNGASHRGTKKKFSGLRYDDGIGVFVDDFIDTGKTAKKAIIKYLDSFDIPHDQAYKKIDCILVSGPFDDNFKDIKKLANYFNIPVIFANGYTSIYPEF